MNKVSRCVFRSRFNTLFLTLPPFGSQCPHVAGFDVATVTARLVHRLPSGQSVINYLRKDTATSLLSRSEGTKIHMDYPLS